MHCWLHKFTSNFKDFFLNCAHNFMSKVKSIITACCLGGLCSGAALGWSSPALPRLVSPDSSLALEPAQVGWVGSLVCLGAVLQGPFTGWFMTR